MASDPLMHGRPDEREPREAHDEPAWEHADGGVVSALLRTVLGVLFRPRPTFRGMSSSQQIGKPFVFVILTMVAASLLTAAGAGLADTGFFALLIIGSMLITVPLLFVEAGTYHVLLMVLGGTRGGFGATFRVCAYVDGSTALIGCVPVFGPVVALVWGAYLRIVGLREIHRTTTTRVVVSLILAGVVPVLLVGGAVSVLVILVLSMLDSAPAPVVEV